MPICRTVSGLIYLDELDSEMGWKWVQDGTTTHAVDTTTKHSGTGSFWSRVPSVGGGHWEKDVNLGTGSARRIYIWHKTLKVTTLNAVCLQLVQNGVNMQQVLAVGCTATEDWTRHSATIDYTLTGIYTIWMNVLGGAPSCEAWVDRFLITSDRLITITGLTAGQKVDIYRASDDGLIGTATATGTSVTIDVDAEEVPEQMYLKFYATDGSTLIETTGSYELCAGDTWNWTSAAGTMSLATDAVVIYRSDAVGTPKTANLTATLLTPGGVPYPSKTVYFSTTLGSVTPASDTTDANGHAETALTATTHGIAVVMAQWLGDSNVPACSAFAVVHVFYETEAPDVDKAFQFFCQGIEYSYATGRYTWNERGDTESFEVQIPMYLSTLTANGLVSIYRKGVKEFSGLFKSIERTLGDSPQVILRGPDISFLLDDTVVPLVIYSAKTPAYIINDLLTKYPCGIAPGVLQSSTDALTVTIDTESLHAAIDRICSDVNWHYRVNMDRTLDLAESFTGGISAAEFTEGINLLPESSHITDYSAVANWIRMKGDGIYSTKQDGTMIQAQSLHQGTAFQSKISNQATLDLVCQALLDLEMTQLETLKVSVKDDYAAGVYGCEDLITVTSATLGLSGMYPVVSIERDMTQGDLTTLQLSNRTMEYWMLDEAYRRMTKDASV